jgi:hypothetical protein
VLVTARGRLAALAGVRRVPLGGLGPAEAERLLRRLLAGAAEPLVAAVAGPEVSGSATAEQLRLVLDACAGLPLALRAAAERIAAGRGLGALAARLADEQRRLAELSPDGRGVAGALLSAARRVVELPGGAAALALLRQAAAPAGTVVPDGALVPGGRGTPDGPVGPDAAAELLGLLVEHGLLQAAVDGRYLLHPLTALFASGGWTVDGIRMSGERSPLTGYLV